jgi:hypothetical protein
MSLATFAHKVIANLRGAWSLVDGRESSPERGFIAENVQFSPNSVKSREPFVSALAVTSKVTAMYNWIAGGINRLVYQEGSTVKLWDLASTFTTLFTLTGRTFSVAEAGNRLFFCGFDNNGLASQSVKVVSPLTLGSPADDAFAAPWTATLNATDFGAGDTTAGLHKFAYIVETRSGFVGQPSPTPGNVFTPNSFTVTGGTRTVQLSVTNNIPVDAAFVQFIMTRSDNPNKWYFIPGATVAVPGGAVGWTVAVNVSISDSDLAATAQEATDNFLLLARQSGGGGSPISPNFLLPYGRRLVYCSDTKLYISDVNAFQNLAEDRNTVQSPGQRHITTAFTLRGVLYFLGDRWTSSIADNGDFPRTWEPPQEVAAIGTSAPYGVECRSAGDYAWVASESGLYLFNGQYTSLPISYRNTDIWNRINWAAAPFIQVKDDYVNHKVYVLAPLDSNTEPSHLLVWDYTNGLEVDTVDFSLWYIGSRTLSSIAMVKDFTSGRSTMWVGPSGAGNIVKYTAGGHTDDGATAIHSIWETGAVLSTSERPAHMTRFWQYFVKIRGAGTLLLKVYSKDRVRNISLLNVTLATAPGKEIQRKGEMQSENISIRFETNAVGEYFDLEGLEVFYKPWTTVR